MTCSGTIPLVSNICQCSIGSVYDKSNLSLCVLCTITSNCLTCDPNNISKCLSCDSSITLNGTTCPCAVGFTPDISNPSKCTACT